MGVILSPVVDAGAGCADGQQAVEHHVHGAYGGTDSTEYRFIDLAKRKRSQPWPQETALFEST